MGGAKKVAGKRSLVTFVTVFSSFIFRHMLWGFLSFADGGADFSLGKKLSAPNVGKCSRFRS